MEYEFQIARKILHCWQEYVAKDTRLSDDSRWIDKMKDIGFLFNFEEITFKIPSPSSRLNLERGWGVGG